MQVKLSIDWSDFRSLSVCLSICPSACPPIHPPVYLSIYLAMSLQPFVAPWQLCQFLDLLHSQYESLDGDQAVARPLPTHRTAQTDNKRTQTSMPQVRFEPTITVFDPAKTVHALERAATMIGPQIFSRSVNVLLRINRIRTSSIVRCLKTAIEHNVSETGFVSIFRWWGERHLFCWFHQKELIPVRGSVIEVSYF
jgi:hypothetical protein